MTQSNEAWTEHEAAQRRAWLTLSHAERLAWLEQAKRFAALAVASRARKQT